MIDNKEMYHLGASIKDLGKKCFGINKIEDMKIIEKIFNLFWRSLRYENTIIYLIRHAETIEENGIRNTNEDSQIINEKEILSVYGEQQSQKLSRNIELKNIDIIWSSSYARAKATAKYIASKNNLPINIDSSLNERKLGNLKELGEFMKDKKTKDPSQEQLIDINFKTSDGESAEDTRKRMTNFFNRILKDYFGKKIAVISHRRINKILFIKLV